MKPIVRAYYRYLLQVIKVLIYDIIHLAECINGYPPNLLHALSTYDHTTFNALYLFHGIGSSVPYKWTCTSIDKNTVEKYDHSWTYSTVPPLLMSSYIPTIKCCYGVMHVRWVTFRDDDTLRTRSKLFDFGRRWALHSQCNGITIVIDILNIYLHNYSQ